MRSTDVNETKRMVTLSERTFVLFDPKTWLSCFPGIFHTEVCVDVK